MARIIEAARKGLGHWDNDSEASHVNVGDKVWTLTFANDDAPEPKDWWTVQVSEEVFIAMLSALHALAVATLFNHST